tara:strand:- start:1027 stop:1248 length:222 start_codon:yes stop_codon:yes gene_type:complete
MKVRCIDDPTLFWNCRNGWGDEEEAETFTRAESKKLFRGNLWGHEMVFLSKDKLNNDKLRRGEWVNEDEESAV